MAYIAYLHKDRNSDFGVSFPDFPGCITAGRTREEAQRMAAEALSLHIQGMIEDGEEIPEPRRTDESDWARVDAMTEEDIQRAIDSDPDTFTVDDWDSADLIMPKTPKRRR